MKNNINIAEILKDCPEGMELDCVMYENVVFDYIAKDNDVFPIKCHIKLPNNKCTVCSFTAYGCCSLHNYSKCVIFPKGKTTWEGFVSPCKFKVGDRIKSVISSSYYTVVDIKNNNYFIKSDNEKYPYQVSFEHEINYQLVPNKFDITTLKPFESRVLVRHADYGEWRPAIFGYYKKVKPCPFAVVGGICYLKCIPYEGNEHLLGTTNDCEEFYKTWE